MKSACPLDCYDACAVIYEDGKLKGDPNHPFTKGFLCPSLNGFLKQDRILSPSFNKKEISMDEALEILSSTLKANQDKKSLLFRGSGNFGKMQDVTNVFFEKYGSIFTRGSICDGAGHNGIVQGRGANFALPISQIKKSEVVVVWGRDVSVCNSHMMDVIKDKILIVIDPVKTKIAKIAHIHLQLKPRSDFFLAILLARFAHMEEMEDWDFINEHCEDYDYFCDFYQGFGIKKLIEKIDVGVDDILTTLMFFRDMKVSILVGVGVQKYTHGSEVLRAIDSFFAMVGLFGKEGCGVSYLGDSSYGFSNPFQTKAKTTPKPIVDFGEFETVFIQGANPISQMPSSNKVQEGLKKSSFVVYFGLYENESSKMADLIIPAKTFLEKEDLRFSYGSEYIFNMPKILESDVGISEYELAKYLHKSFGYENLKCEDEYINEILSSNSKEIDGYLHSASFDGAPYFKGFYTDSGKFIFMDEVCGEDDLINDDGYYLITSKYRYSINSQFKRDNYLYISASCGFDDGDMVEASSIYGKKVFEVKISEDLRDDIVKICSGTLGVNFLTSFKKSVDGDSAVLQEVKINIKKV